MTKPLGDELKVRSVAIEAEKARAIQLEDRDWAKAYIEEVVRPLCCKEANAGFRELIIAVFMGDEEDLYDGTTESLKGRALELERLLKEEKFEVKTKRIQDPLNFAPPSKIRLMSRLSQPKKYWCRSMSLHCIIVTW